jgi:REP element-mobilizing transposase RayT
MKVKKLRHCAYAHGYHLVLVTKCSRRCLSAQMLDELEVILQEQLSLKG